MDNYLPIVCMFVLSIVFAALSFAASSLLGPKHPTSAKSTPYECGIVPEREPAERFPVRFYIVAMVFIVIDIEIIFLYPWAVIFRQLSTFGLVEMVLFAVAGLLWHRDDVHRGGRLRPRPLRYGGLPGVAPAGRPHDRRRPGLAEDGSGAAPGLRPDARAQVGDLDGRVRLHRRDVQQLRHRPGRRSGRSCRRLHARVPTHARDVAALDPHPAREDPHR